MKGLYFSSQYDAEWHNLKDFEYVLSEDKKSAMIGIKTGEGFRVDYEVDVFTFEEMVEFYNMDKCDNCKFSNMTY